MVRAGLVRALWLFLGAAAVSAAAAAFVAAASGTGLARALSVAWYATGAFVLLLGFVVATRGPTRATDPVSLRARSRRWATRSEQEESLGLSAVLVCLGLGLILLGVLVDPRHPLF